LAEETCPEHPDEPGNWWCGNCRRVLCGDCIRQEFRKGKWIRLCRTCGQSCRPVGRTPAEPRRKGFFAELPRAFVYPLIGRGKYVILAGGIVFSVLTVAREIGVYIGPYAVAFLRAAGLVVGCIIPAYVFEVIRHSAAGEGEPPDWPAVTNWLTDLVRPVLLIVVVAAVSFLPAAVFRILVFYEVLGHSGTVWVPLGLGLLYLPMALLGVAMFDGVAGVSPTVVVPAIFRTVRAYLVACAAMAAMAGLWVPAAGLVRLSVPLLGSVLGGATTIYFLMVEARICGLIYCCYSERLDWFPGG